MSNASLSITATLTNGGDTRRAELSRLVPMIQAAIQQVLSHNGAATSGSVGGAYNSQLGASDPATASFTYTPVAST